MVRLLIVVTAGRGRSRAHRPLARCRNTCCRQGEHPHSTGWLVMDYRWRLAAPRGGRWRWRRSEGRSLEVRRRRRDGRPTVGAGPNRRWRRVEVVGVGERRWSGMVVVVVASRCKGGRRSSGGWVRREYGLRVMRRRRRRRWLTEGRRLHQRVVRRRRGHVVEVATGGEGCLLRAPRCGIRRFRRPGGHPRAASRCASGQGCQPLGRLGGQDWGDRAARVVVGCDVLLVGSPLLDDGDGGRWL